MAKKSKIAKEKKIEATIAKYAPLRAKYKAYLLYPSGAADEERAGLLDTGRSSVDKKRRAIVADTHIQNTT